MDTTESLKKSENSLRDLISYILSKKYGKDWIKACGITDERIDKFKERKSIDEKKFGHSEPRLIYYSDFFDLKTIIKKNWDNEFSKVFGKLKEAEMMLDILDDLRNPEAHRRELLPYQKHLGIGISGKIRSSITKYFSEMETGDSYYPRIESVLDSLGNTWAIGESKSKKTKNVLRPNDHLQFKVMGSDPKGEQLEYALISSGNLIKIDWNKINEFELIINKSHVRKSFWITVAIRSKREFHARSKVGLGKVDDVVQFGYEVLPPRKN